MIKATIIFGSDAVRHYDETEEIPDIEAFEDTGCLIVPKVFQTKEQYDSYVEALDDYDGFNDYRVVDRVETKETDLLSRFSRLLREEPLAALYLVTAMEFFRSHIADLSDDKLRKTFEFLIQPGRVRADVGTICNRLNNLPDDHQSE